MKILIINVVCGIRSTGRICTDLALAYEQKGHKVKIAYGRDDVPDIYAKYAVRIGNDFDVKLHGLQARIFDNCGFGSINATKRFIKWTRNYDPDLIHIHNLHGYYINVEILFKYLQECNKRVVWTLHDCWAYTGHCTYYDYQQCSKWIEQCEKCPQKKEYPTSIFVDKSKKHYLMKRKLFSSVSNITFVTPSQWLKNEAKRSFLKNKNIVVINNGIDVNVFKPTHGEITKKYKQLNKKIILGVAAVWNRRKGLEDFIKLSKLLTDEYLIILVGFTTEQKSNLPNNIIGIERTNNVSELAEYYTLSNIFINPTYEDNYPSTNLEAIACGTPVISYDTGGSGESATLFGKTIQKGNIEMIRDCVVSCNKERMLPIDVKVLSKEYMAQKYLNILNIGE